MVEIDNLKPGPLNDQIGEETVITLPKLLLGQTAKDTASSRGKDKNENREFAQSLFHVLSSAQPACRRCAISQGNIQPATWTQLAQHQRRQQCADENDG